ncbi:DNA-binding transcriptional regulator AraC [compost metagenome]
MIIKPFTPHPALQPYILAYACVEVNEHINASNPIHIFPVDYTVMCFSLDGKKQIHELNTAHTVNYPLGYVGFLSRLRSFDSFTKKVVQVYFKPFGAYKLLGVPQHYFTNSATDMESIFPTLRSTICQMQDEIACPQKVISILENWLLQRLLLSENICTARIEYACSIIRAYAGNIGIEALARQVAMSPTTLRDHFKEKIGFNPKTFGRIVRFSQLNRLLCENKNVKWADLADKFEFFDQTHFIKEFKHFFGCTPSQLHKKGKLSFTGKLTDDLGL